MGLRGDVSVLALFLRGWDINSGAVVGNFVRHKTEKQRELFCRKSNKEAPLQREAEIGAGSRSS